MADLMIYTRHEEDRSNAIIAILPREEAYRLIPLSRTMSDCEVHFWEVEGDSTMKGIKKHADVAEYLFFQQMALMHQTQCSKLTALMKDADDWRRAFRLLKDYDGVSQGCTVEQWFDAMYEQLVSVKALFPWHPHAAFYKPMLAFLDKQDGPVHVDAIKQHFLRDSTGQQLWADHVEDGTAALQEGHTVHKLYTCRNAAYQLTPAAKELAQYAEHLTPLNIDIMMYTAKKSCTWYSCLTRASVTEGECRFKDLDRHLAQRQHATQNLGWHTLSKQRLFWKLSWARTRTWTADTGYVELTKLGRQLAAFAEAAAPSQAAGHDETRGRNANGKEAPDSSTQPANKSPPSRKNKAARKCLLSSPTHSHGDSGSSDDDVGVCPVEMGHYLPPPPEPRQAACDDGVHGAVECYAAFLHDKLQEYADHVSQGLVAEITRLKAAGAEQLRRNEELQAHFNNSQADKARLEAEITSLRAEKSHVEAELQTLRHYVYSCTPSLVTENRKCP